MQLSEQAAYLFLLALPIACISWTVTHEEVFKEPRDFCIKKSKFSKTILQRKFFYLFTANIVLALRDHWFLNFYKIPFVVLLTGVGTLLEVLLLYGFPIFT